MGVQYRSILQNKELTKKHTKAHTNMTLPRHTHTYTDTKKNQCRFTVRSRTSTADKSRYFLPPKAKVQSSDLMQAANEITCQKQSTNNLCDPELPCEKSERPLVAKMRTMDLWNVRSLQVKKKIYNIFWLLLLQVLKNQHTPVPVVCRKRFY